MTIYSNSELEVVTFQSFCFRQIPSQAWNLRILFLINFTEGKFSPSLMLPSFFARRFAADFVSREYIKRIFILRYFSVLSPPVNSIFVIRAIRDVTKH